MQLNCERHLNESFFQKKKQDTDQSTVQKQKQKQIKDTRFKMFVTKTEL